jgi:hypothetical protein
MTFGAKGVQALTTGNTGMLTNLDLSTNDIGIEGIQALTKSNLNVLSSLNLSYDGIDNEEQSSGNR